MTLLQIEQPIILQTMNDKFNFEQALHDLVCIQTNADHNNENPKDRRSCSATPLEIDDIDISKPLHTTCTNKPKCQVLCEELNKHRHAQIDTYEENLPVNLSNYSTEHDANNGVKDNAAEDTCNPLIDLKIPHVITVSEKVIDCPKLLIALESRTCIQVIERDYMGITKLAKTNYPKISADLIINGNTAVIIQDFVSLKEGNIADNTMYHLSALSLQFTSCWLIAFPLSDKGYLHDTSLGFVNTISYIHAISTCFFDKKSRIKILTAGTVEDAADLIRAIADCSFHENRNWDDGSEKVKN
uniref:Uncharacterized protein n=1 Tax=Eptatretus burgeri TaxID=7764 RepID=A0A8C4PW00_EPTBU